MRENWKHRSVRLRAALVAVTLAITAPMSGHGEEQASGPKILGGPSLLSIEGIPASPLRTKLDTLNPNAKSTALKRLRAHRFPAADLDSLRADDVGEIYYTCVFGERAEGPSLNELPAPESSAGSLPIAPFPNSLKFHSKPGATNVLYLDFDGEVTGYNAWFPNQEFHALPYSMDSDFENFSAVEQQRIKDAWKFVAEDYAPFDVDVTTERPAVMHSRVSHLLVTFSTDRYGLDHAYKGWGGVAYVGVFGTSNNEYYAPAWVFLDGTGTEPAYVGACISHESGHTFGLAHDGKSDGTEYYDGHGVGAFSWGPIMGSGYYSEVTQWSRGEYYLASNFQDDLAVLAGVLNYRYDDHANIRELATPILFEYGTNITSTTPENDPYNIYSLNKGIIQSTNDLDWFTFNIIQDRLFHLEVNALTITNIAHRGGNLNVEAALFDSAGALVQLSSATNSLDALIHTNLTAGRYYVRVRSVGIGNPLASSPYGFTAYGSIGQYFLNGHIAPVEQPSYRSNYSDMTVAGTFNGWNQAAKNMQLVGDYTWASTQTLNHATGVRFKFVANSSWSINWGESNQSDKDIPVEGQYAEGNNADIVINGTLNGTFVFTFNELTRAYTVRELVVDTDNDGLPDWWELQYFGNLLQGPDDDPDGDGKRNMTEYLAGWDPTVPNYASDYASMTVAGTFNGWNQALNNMSQAADYVWVSTQTLNHATGVRFKFVANSSWSINWGESNQSDKDLPIQGQFAESGNGDILINGTLNGTFVFTFNEQTRAYTVVSQVVDTDGDGLPDAWELQYFGNLAQGPNDDPDGDGKTNLQEYLAGTDPTRVDYASNYSSMTVAGTFNGWNQAAKNMQLVGDYTWVSTQTLNNASAVRFKFVANADWGVNWGESNQSDKDLPILGQFAESGNGDILINGTLNGTFVFTFNEQTRAYTVTKVGVGFLSDYSSMTVAGSFNGWNQAANNMTQVGDYVWEATITINETNPEFKFVANGNWGVNWGESDLLARTLPIMTGAEQGAGNIRIGQTVTGAVKFSFNEQTRTYIVKYP